MKSILFNYVPKKLESPFFCHYFLKELRNKIRNTLYHFIVWSLHVSLHWYIHVSLQWSLHVSLHWLAPMIWKWTGQSLDNVSALLVLQKALNQSLSYLKALVSATSRRERNKVMGKIINFPGSLTINYTSVPTVSSVCTDVWRYKYICRFGNILKLKDNNTFSLLSIPVHFCIY